METSGIRPFLIGICGGPLSGKVLLSKKISELISSDYKVCTISLKNYYKNLKPEDYIHKEKYNFDRASAIDFDLLYEDLKSLLNKKVVKLPTYDISTCIRKDKQEEVQPSDVIIIEGIFCFYHDKIRNLIDLKIFIDVDNDIQLSRIICRDIFVKNLQLKTSIERYHKFIKPSYNRDILPTRKYADIILQKVSDYTSAIEIVGEYLKLQLSKMLKNHQKDLFSFIYEIIDPKYKYYDGKILVEDESNFISFIKEVFQDFINEKLDKDLIPYIRVKMVEMLYSLLIRDIKSKKNDDDDSFPENELLLTDEDDLTKYGDFKEYNNIYYFKTAILSENDISGPKQILTMKKNIHLTIFSIFLAPKFTDILLSKEIYTVIFSTIYYSDFFIQLGELIKNDDSVFNDKQFKELFSNNLENYFNNGKDDLSDLKFHG